MGGFGLPKCSSLDEDGRNRGKSAFENVAPTDFKSGEDAPPLFDAEILDVVVKAHEPLLHAEVVIADVTAAMTRAA
jgi:hypothetical protein